MKKTWMLFFLFAAVFLIAGCTNEELESQIVQLKEEIEMVKNEKETLQLEVIELEKQLTNSLEEKKFLEQELDAFVLESSTLRESLDAHYDMLSDSEMVFTGVLDAIQNEFGDEKLKDLHIFNPDNIEKGDRVGEFQVATVKREAGIDEEMSYYIDFHGEFEVEGELVTSQGSSGYLFLVDAKEFLKYPQPIVYLASSRTFVFKIANTEYLLEEVGDRIEGMDLTYGSYPMRAIFTDYSFNYVPYTDIRSSAVLKQVTGTEM